MRHLPFRVILAGCVVTLAFSSSPTRSDEKLKPSVIEAANKFTAIEREWQKAQQTYRNAIQATKTLAERKQVVRPDRKSYAVRFMKVAEAYPDTWGGGAALIWIICNALDAENAGQALTKLKEGPIAKADLGLLKGLLFFGNSERSHPIQEVIAPLVFARITRELEHPKAADLLIWVYNASANDGSVEGIKLSHRAGDLLVSRFPETPTYGVFARR